MSVKSLKDVQALEVICNWDSNIPDKDINDTVLFDYDEKEVENLKDFVNVKTTVSFIMPERHNDKPAIQFSIPPEENFRIDSISLLCDSKMIEVFGEHRMYLDTFNGAAIEETDEFYVYEYKIDLSQKKNRAVSLKFVKLVRPKNLWIYGILLKLKKTENSSSSRINFDNVEELLKNSHISEQANQAFSFLREASTNVPIPVPTNGNSPSNVPDSVQSHQIKAYIDFKFQILTDYLIMREKGLNDKLDRIIEIMKAKD